MMQGWRKHMEDIIISSCDYEPNESLFAIFDGHGGNEVAYFCERKFKDALIQSKSYKMGLYS